MARAPVGARSILYLVTEDWYFWSHRVALARRARAHGYAVLLGTRATAHRARIEQAGIECVELPFERSMRHPLRDARAACGILRLIRARRPTLVHLVALKPMLLAALAIRCCPSVPFVHAVTGLGYLFTNPGRRGRLLRALVVRWLRFAVNRPNAWLIVQNEADARLLRETAIGVPARTRLIRGSGVDTLRFAPSALPASTPLVVLPARLLRDKGVAEFVAAARLVRGRGSHARFVLVGPCDPDNPAAIPEAQVRAWTVDGAVEWWGPRADMPDVYAQATIVCLPSYREGLPKALLEGAACARPLVATDVPGCREVCRQGQTGLLVPPRDAAALAAAIERLLGDDDACRRFGTAGRALVEHEFSSERIADETMALYADALAAR